MVCLDLLVFQDQEDKLENLVPKEMLGTKESREIQVSRETLDQRV